MDIMIDVSIAKNTSEKYKSTITTITNTMTELDNCIKNLGDNWKGDARDKFTLEHFPSYLKSMQDFIDMLTVLKDEIDFAISDFNDLDVELKSNFGVK